MEVVLLSPDTLHKSNFRNFLNKSDIMSIKQTPLKKRGESALGRIALKKAYNLFNRLKVHPLQIKILKNKRGVPFVKNNSRLFCSISHSYGYAVAAIDNKAVGIDIEKIRSHKKELMNYVSLPEELKRVSEKNPNLTITKIWVIKEAVLKAISMGFRLSPKNIKICKRIKNSYRVIISNGHKLHRKEFNVLAFRWKGFYIAIAMEAYKDDKYKINWNNFASVQLPAIKSIYR